MRRLIGVTLVASFALVATTGFTAAPTGAQPDPAECTPGDMPYADLEGAALEPEVHTSVDDDPVAYVRWSGTVPGFDGMPFSVDVTVPCGATEPLPAILMLHGFTDDKTVWQETGKGDSVESADRPATNSYWNNIWFASQGYVVVNYTARGWRDSCGPDTPGTAGATPAPQCADYEYWIHLDDVRWEVRDAQWFAGGLVQSGTAHADRLAITGGSYGGAPTVNAALLAGNTVCGGAAVPEALGEDPCADADNGELVPWTTPDGETELTWAAAVALYTFGDILNVLAPNGRVTDGWELAPESGDPVDPLGVPLQSTVSLLRSGGEVTGRFAPTGGDLDYDVLTTSDRLLAGTPFPPDDPVVVAGVGTFREFKSPIETEPEGDVPIFWVQGFTDALFPAMEAISVMNAVTAVEPDYPFKVFLGDIGHDYAGEAPDEWAYVKDDMNAFVDHYLDPSRTPDAPVFDVSATVTRCLDQDADLQVVSAPTWPDLHPDHTAFTGDEGGTTDTATRGPSGAATDPISTATLPGPDSYKGCRIVEPSQTDPNSVTYDFDVDEELVLMGGPVVDVGFDASGPDTMVAVRLWDVTADGSRQGLVTRGVYRVADAGEQRARFQLSLQGYRFEEGHTIRVEVTANDEPFLQRSNTDATLTVSDLELTLPLYDESAPAPSGTGAADDPSDDDGAPWFWILVGVAALVVIGVLVVAIAGSRRRRPPS